MTYEIGDTVVHRTHGLGKVTAIEEKNLSGRAQLYYVVEVGLLQIWVPIEKEDDCSIRYPITGIQFVNMFEILSKQGEELPDNQYQRKTTLRERMQNRTLDGLCRVIRDLSDRKRNHPLNQSDTELFIRAEEHLLDEWVLSLGVERSQAQNELIALLGQGLPSPVEE